jgi:ABC-type transport system involved in cytochrome c biogenesis permease component
VFAILLASLRRELRTGEALLPMLLFSLVVILVSGFAFDLPELAVAFRERLVTGILWISIAFAMIVGQARHLLADREEERWSGLLLAPLDRTLLFAIKWIEGLLLGVALEVVLLPLWARSSGPSWPGSGAGRPCWRSWCFRLRRRC